MTTRPVGMELDLEATPNLVSRPHDRVVLGIVGTSANATASGAPGTGDAIVPKIGSIYVLNSLNALSRAAWTEFDSVARADGASLTPADFFGAGSLIDALEVAENIGNFTVVLIPVAGSDSAASVAAVNSLDPESGGGSHPKPGVIAAPSAMNTDAGRLAVASALNTIANRMDAQAVVRIPASMTSAAARKTWAATFVPGASSPGTIRRTRVTLGTSQTGATGSRNVANDSILAAYMAKTQSEDLGEDPANTPTIIHATDPILAFAIDDFTTAAQDLAASYITPVIRYGGTFRFWGRASGPDPDDDHGYTGVLDAIFEELKALLGGYSQRNLPGEAIEIMVTRGQHLVDARRRDGQIADAVISRHPTLDTPVRLHANELYLYLAVQRIPYARFIHLQVSPHGVLVLGAPSA